MLLVPQRTIDLLLLVVREVSLNRCIYTEIRIEKESNLRRSGGGPFRVEEREKHVWLCKDTKEGQCAGLLPARKVVGAEMGEVG